MKRSAELRRITPLAARSGLSRGTSLTRSPWPRSPHFAVVDGASAPVHDMRQKQQRRGKPLNPVSGKRRAENRVRAALIKELYPERPRCARPGCTRMADDIHENMSRARSGGSITDPALWVPLCRPCHDEVTFRPESELGWAYDCGLLVHSWDRTPGGAA